MAREKRITYHRPTTWDVDQLKQHMRQVDRDEAHALSAMNHADLVDVSMMQPGYSISARVPEGLICIFGFSAPSAVGECAIPWLLGTDLLKQNTREMFEQSRIVIDHAINEQFVHLENLVWEGNTWAKRYLKHLGFRIEPAEKNSRGFMQHRFYLSRGMLNV